MKQTLSILGLVHLLLAGNFFQKIICLEKQCVGTDQTASKSR